MAAPAPRITANGTALTIEDAGHIISRYLQSFGENPASCRHTVTYTIVTTPNPLIQPPPTGPTLQATVTLPPCAGFTNSFATKTSYPSKLMAKRVACFDACEALLDRGDLDDNLMPSAPRKEKKARVREGRDPASLSRWVEEGDRALGEGDEDLERGLSLSARWEVFKGTIKAALPDISPGVGAGAGGIGEYEALTPDGLDEVAGRRPWMTALKLPNERVLGLLTFKQLADGEEELDLGLPMKMVDLGQIKKLSEEQMDLASRYTEQAIRSQMNKDLHIPSAPCWLLVPLIRTFDSSKARRTDIDWEEMSSTLASAPASIPFSTDPATVETEMVDAIATNPAEYGRRFFVGERTDLTPSSPHPEDPMRTILQCTFPRTAPPEPKHPDLPIYTAIGSTSGRSGGILSPNTSVMRYIIPEFYQRYCFPQSTFRTLSTIPTFFVLLTDLLAAKQLNARLFDNTLTPALSLQAITPAMSSPNSPHKSYERLEILGDTLIKLLTTLDTCLLGPLSDQSRVDRHILLSNRSLRANGVKAGIAPYIRYKEGRAKAWIPDGWLLDSEKTADELPVKRMIKLGDKVVADVVESLVGASYVSCNRSLDAAISTMKRLNIPVDRLDTWADVAEIFTKRSSLDLHVAPEPNGKKAETNGVKDGGKSQGVGANGLKANGIKANGETVKANSETVKANGDKIVPNGEEKPEKAKKVKTDSWLAAFTKPIDVPILGYTFRDPGKGALVFDGSSATRGRQDFQRYKIIGDSLLDYFVVEKLYDSEETYSPAVITHMKHSRNADQALAAMAVCLGLADRMKEIDKPVLEHVTRYKLQLDTRWKQAEKALKRKEDDGKIIEFWAGTSHAPVSLLSSFADQTLGAIPEVLMGAIVADQAGDLTAARKVFFDHFWPFMEKFGVGPINHSLHPKSVMQELFGKFGCTNYKILRLDEKVKGVVCSVELHGKELGRAMAESQTLATRAACENVLAVLTKEMVQEICTCGYTQPLPAREESVA